MTTMNDVLGTVKAIGSMKDAVSDLKSSVTESFASTKEAAQAGMGDVQDRGRKDAKKIKAALREVNMRSISDRVLRELDLERRPSFFDRSAKAFGYVAFGVAVGAIAVALIPELREGLESALGRAEKLFASSSKKVVKGAKSAAKAAEEVSVEFVDEAAEATSNAKENVKENASKDGASNGSDFGRDARKMADKNVGRA